MADVGPPILPMAILLPLMALYNFFNIDPPRTNLVNRGVTEYYDFIVVGGGSAGAVMASRLSEDPKVRVLLLEAGGDETVLSEMPALCSYLQLSELDWKYLTEPQPLACLGFTNRQCPWPRGKVLGGSSTLNYMVYIRGNRRDYDRWAALGNYGWSYEEVLPYFIKSEDNTSPWAASDYRYHGVGGYLTVSEVPYRTPMVTAFLQAGLELGYPTRDCNGHIQTGFMPVQATLRRGARCSTAKAFIRPASKRPNLTVLLNAFALKVLFDNKKRAYGVVFERLGKEYVVKATREIILSAGAVNTPQLLLLSGVGPRAHLEKHGIPVVADLPGVGENLQDHLTAGAIIFTINQALSIKQERLESVSHVLDWMINGRGPLTVLGGLEATAFVKTPYTNVSDDWPDMQMQYISGSAASDNGKQLKRVMGFNNVLWEGYFAPLVQADTISFIPTMLRPKSRGYIQLRSTNPYEHPIIEPKYYSHPDDIHVMVEGLKVAVQIGFSKAFQRFGAKITPLLFPGCGSFQMYSDEYFACIARHYSSTIYHPVGTAKMGVPTDPMAVVDPQLRVYEVSGLRVVDASIMPLIVSGNTNAPVIMIAEKASDLIKQYWGKQNSG